MKKLLPFLMAGLLVGAAACNKNIGPSSGTPVHDGPSGRIRVEIDSSPESKASDAEKKDFQINTVQVLVFNSGTGTKETDRFETLSPAASGSTAITLNTLTGLKVVYALVNAPRVTVNTLSALEAHLSDLKENSATNLVMSGKTTVTVQEYDTNKNPSATAQAFSVNVKRLAAMIVLDKVTVNFKGTMLEGGSFTIQEIYAKNVMGKAPMGVDGTGKPLTVSDTEHQNAANWYNPKTKVAGCPDITADAFSLPCTADAETPVGHFLLVYPNKTTGDSTDETFGPRKTRLVIKARVTSGSFASPAIDEVSYYTFDMPVLQANNVYKVTNINISMLGKKNDDTDEKTLVGVLTPTITVDPWFEPVPIKYEM